MGKRLDNATLHGPRRWSILMLWHVLNYQRWLIILYLTKMKYLAKDEANLAICTMSDAAWIKLRVRNKYILWFWVSGPARALILQGGAYLLCEFCSYRVIFVNLFTTKVVEKRIWDLAKYIEHMTLDLEYPRITKHSSPMFFFVGPKIHWKRRFANILWICKSPCI